MGEALKSEAPSFSERRPGLSGRARAQGGSASAAPYSAFGSFRDRARKTGKLLKCSILLFPKRKKVGKRKEKDQAIHAQAVSFI